MQIVTPHTCAQFYSCEDSTMQFRLSVALEKFQTTFSRVVDGQRGSSFEAVVGDFDTSDGLVVSAFQLAFRQGVGVLVTVVVVVAPNEMEAGLWVADE